MKNIIWEIKEWGFILMVATRLARWACKEPILIIDEEGCHRSLSRDFSVEKMRKH